MSMAVLFACSRPTPKDAVTVPMRCPLELDDPFLQFQLAADLLDDLRGVLETRIWKDQREFLAAETRDLVLALDVLDEQVGEELEHLVADQMAETVVDALEIVEIAERDAKVLTVGAREGDLFGERKVEEAAVADAGYRVALTNFLGAGEL